MPRKPQPRDQEQSLEQNLSRLLRLQEEVLRRTATPLDRPNRSLKVAASNAAKAEEPA